MSGLKASRTRLKSSIVSSYSKSVFSAMGFDENPLTCQREISGLKASRTRLKNSIVSSLRNSKSVFSAMCFDENPLTCQRENENKKAYGFQISHVILFVVFK